MFETIQRYLKLDNFPYALFINGKWGSGKTWYIKETFPKEFTDKKVLYTSLNGVNSIDDFEQQILFRKIKIQASINDPKIKLVGSIVKQFSSDIIKKYTGFDTNKIELNDFVKISDNEVLIIDDLERSGKDLDLIEFLGYIQNNFIEENKIKIILIADETELMNSLTESILKKYEKIKEKSIWQTVDFILRIETFYDDLINKFENLEKSKLILENKSFIIKKFYDYEIKNIRTVSYFLFVLDEIFKISNSLINDINIHRVLNSTLILCNEFKLGKINSNKIPQCVINNINGIISVGQTWLHDGFSLKETNHTKDDFEIYFNRKYLSAGSKDYIYFESISDLVCKGVFSEIKFKEEILKLHKPEVEILTEDLDVLNQLEQKDFEEKWKNLLSYVDSDKCCLHDLLNVAGIFEYYSLNGIKFGIERRDLYSLLNSKIDSINEYYDYYKSKNNKYYIIIKEEHFKEASNEFLILEELVQTRSEHLFKLSLSNQVTDLVNKFHKLSEISKNDFQMFIYNCSDEQLIKFVPVAIKNSKISSQISEYINEAYKHFVPEDETDFLDKVIKLVNECLQQTVAGSIIWSKYNMIKPKLDLIKKKLEEKKMEEKKLELKK